MIRWISVVMAVLTAVLLAGWAALNWIVEAIAGPVSRVIGII